MIQADTQKLRTERISRGLNLEDVARGADIHTATYCRIENGLSRPRPKTAKRICDFLNRPFSELFELIDKEE